MKKRKRLRRYRMSPIQAKANKFTLSIIRDLNTRAKSASGSEKTKLKSAIKHYAAGLKKTYQAGND